MNSKWLRDFFTENSDNIVSIVSILCVIGISIAGIFNGTTWLKDNFSAMTLLILSIIALSVTWLTLRFKTILGKHLQTLIFENQQDMCGHLLNYINENHVKKAILIQYSGIMVEDIILALMERGVDEITLYVQSKATAKFSHSQLKRISAFSNLMSTEVALRHLDKLTIIDYDPPAAFRAIKLDDKVLAVGWYIYYYVDRRNPVERRQFGTDKIKVRGHDQPGTIVFSGSKEYEVMNNLFQRLVKNFSDVKISKKKPVKFLKARKS
ncbi:MAG: hypothetical protein WBW94_13325 [Anaerolineales bacterium]